MAGEKLIKLAVLQRKSVVKIGLSGRDHVVPDGIFDQSGTCLEPQNLHDPVLVKGDSTRLELQDKCNLFHGFSLSKELQDLALAAGDLLLFLVNGTRPEKEFHCVFRDQR
jgi:hypothetical protein